MGAPPASILHGLFILHLVCLAGLVLFIFGAARSGLQSSWPPTRLLIAMLLATSPFLGQLAHHAGYPDDLIALSLCAVAACLNRLGGPVLALCLLASCLLHELCFLLLLPMVAFSLALRRDVGWPHVAWVGASAAVAALLTLTAQLPGPWLVGSLVQAGLQPDIARSQIAEALARTLPDWLAIMAGLWRDNAGNAIAGLAYAGTPALLIMLMAAPQAWRAIVSRTTRPPARFAMAVLYIASGLSGCAVLAIALDLSRVTSFTTLTAFLTTMCLLPHAVQRQPARHILAASGMIVVCYMLTPVFDLHFASGRVIDLARIAPICPPCASAGRHLLEAYDRRLSPALVSQIENDPALGNR